MKHEHLIKFALRYLKKTCIFQTTSGIAEERPDAMGWMASGQSIVLEAKTCRKDLLDEWSRKDRKAFRKNEGQGLGVLRSYLTPPGIVTPDEVEKMGWGLLEVHSGKLIRKAESRLWTPNSLLEIRLLANICSKVKLGSKEPQIEFNFSKHEQEIARFSLRSLHRR